ncbi:uncharacterized protein [Rhodnius prolixus]|uniref:Ciliogenesis-associated TTC17-interacting protein N-terminal domain-containing protein n=1 Tax=Rhodnius prolixus TaxID=13249 RepID=T1I1F7_RHOPR
MAEEALEEEEEEAEEDELGLMYGESKSLIPESTVENFPKLSPDPYIDWYDVYSRTHVALLDIINEKRHNKRYETNRKFKQHYLHVLYVDDIVFNEKLFLYNNKHHRVGVFRLTVNRMEHLTNLEVSAESKIKFSKRILNTSKLHTYSMVDLQYRTVYEMREEFEAVKERSTLRTVEWKKEEMPYKITSAFLDNNYGITEIERFFDAKELSSVFTEGAFMLLLRQLARTNFVGRLKFNLLFINGDICLCNLVVSEIKTINYFQEKISVKNFYKSVKCPNEKIQRSRILMTNLGKLIYQDWSDTDFYLTLDSQAILCENQKPLFTPEDLVPLRYRFYKDVELYTFYTDEYHKHLLEYKDYFKDHPDAVHILSLFLKEVFLKKPHLVCQFASNYFCELL